MTLKRMLIVVCALTLAACRPAAAPASGLKVVAAETFLADIAQNVAGDRLKVEPLMPAGIDPHSFEPTPIDVAKVVDSDVLIVNGAGLEVFLAELLSNAGGERSVIEAAAGLTSRKAREGEVVESEPQHEGDPHFWLDPNNVVVYVENIRDGLSQVDPDGAAIYRANAEVYIAKLRDLDRWIADRVQTVPEVDRKLVTNHESFGYFADRYGFQIIGAIVPSASAGSTPSAQQLAQLIDRIKAAGARAIFLETGANPQLARQAAQETGIAVVTELYSHSTTEADGPAPTYMDMMKFDADTIVNALK